MSLRGTTCSCWSCTGAFVLGEAGLLDGRRVTTHWRFSADLRARFPKAVVSTEGIFERDGRVWTSAGITAGIDLTLALVEEHHGRPPAMAVAKSYVLEHLDQALPVELLARKLGMSPRSLARWCRVELGESPAALVRRLRIERARRLLEETTLPLKAVAARTGLGDASTLWRAFAHHLGVTPAEYRTRFGAASSEGL